MPLLVLYSKHDSTLSFIPLNAVARYHLALDKNNPAHE